MALIDTKNDSKDVLGACASHQKLRPAERLWGVTMLVGWTINPIRVARIPVFPLATLSLAGNHKSASLQVDHPPSPHRNSSRREKQTPWKVPFSRVIRVSIFCLLFLSLPISGWHPRVRLPPGRPPPSLRSRAEGKSTLLEARAYPMPY